jgi:hypothetical protein
MNRSLPPRDRGNRSPASGRASRRARSVPGACRLVGGTAAATHSPDKEKPPRRNPGGQCESRLWRSALDGIGTLAIFALSRSDGWKFDEMAQERQQGSS